MRHIFFGTVVEQITDGDAEMLDLNHIDISNLGAREKPHAVLIYLLMCHGSNVNTLLPT